MEVSIASYVFYHHQDKEYDVHHYENSSVLAHSETYDESLEENQEIVLHGDHHSLQDEQVFNPPIYDEYQDLYSSVDDDMVIDLLEIYHVSNFDQSHPI